MISEKSNILSYQRCFIDEYNDENDFERVFDESI